MNSEGVKTTDEAMAYLRPIVILGIKALEQENVPAKYLLLPPGWLSRISGMFLGLQIDVAPLCLGPAVLSDKLYGRYVPLNHIE